MKCTLVYVLQTIVEVTLGTTRHVHCANFIGWFQLEVIEESLILHHSLPDFVVLLARQILTDPYTSDALLLIWLKLLRCVEGVCSFGSLGRVDPLPVFINIPASSFSQRGSWAREGAIDFDINAVGSISRPASSNMLMTLFMVHFLDVQISPVSFEGAGGDKCGLHFAVSRGGGLSCRVHFYFNIIFMISQKYSHQRSVQRIGSSRNSFSYLITISFC